MDPVTALLALAAGGGSIWANQRANKKIQSAQTQAMRRFYDSMADLRGNARQAADATAQGYTKAPQDQARISGEIAERMRGATRTQYPSERMVDPIADSTSGRVAQEQSRRSTQGYNYTDRLGDALSQMLGYERSMGNADLNARSNAMDLRNIGTSANFDRNVLQTKLDVAPAYGAHYQMIGDILGMLSQGAVAHGMRGPRLNTPQQAARIPVRESIGEIVPPNLRRTG
jgi:hypothetical protein